jgi:hypothetical protein
MSDAAAMARGLNVGWPQACQSALSLTTARSPVQPGWGGLLAPLRTIPWLRYRSPLEAVPGSHAAAAIGFQGRIAA